MKAEDLRIVYMGTPDFAVEPLKELINAGYSIKAVVTAPDKPAGRGQKLSKSAVKQFAEEHNLLVLQPKNLKDELFINTIKSFEPHIIIVVAFRMLPKLVWDIPKYGTFNLHASLLPQYRGAAPINWAIINGEKQTGLTTFLIDDQIDTGSILLQKKVDILPNETAGNLHDKLMILGGKLVIDTVIGLANQSLKPIPQSKSMLPNEGLKLAPKLFREDTQIKWDLPAKKVHDFIRGLSPYPTAWTELKSADGKIIPVKIFKALATSSNNSNSKYGSILSDGKTFIKVLCKQGDVEILEMQQAGKRKVSAKEFLAGFRDQLDSYTFS